MVGNTYLAWEADGGETPEQALAEAITYFERKFGCAPSEALVPLGTALAWPGLEVAQSRSIPPHEVWVGADLSARLLHGAAVMQN